MPPRTGRVSFPLRKIRPRRLTDRDPPSSCRRCSRWFQRPKAEARGRRSEVSAIFKNCRSRPTGRAGSSRLSKFNAKPPLRIANKRKDLRPQRPAELWKTGIHTLVAAWFLSHSAFLSVLRGSAFLPPEFDFPVPVWLEPRDLVSYGVSSASPPAALLPPSRPIPRGT